MTELADYAWLTASETAPLLEKLAEEDSPLHVQLERLRKSHGPQRARLAVELISLRKKAEAKFGSLADRMFFTDIGLQQATDLWIARYKASRFATAHLRHDYCCGIGGDMLGLAEHGPTLGVDRSPESCALAKANLQVFGAAGESEVHTGNVEDYPPGAEVAWHIDPDRRCDGKRTAQLSWSSPGPELIGAWLATAPDGAIKLAPAAIAPEDWQNKAELEWISRNRECRQQVAWFGSLATNIGLRRATRVTTAKGDEDRFEADSFVGLPDVVAPPAAEVREFVYDTDPAIRAAGLTGSFATTLGLESLAGGASYLTSDNRAAHPLASCFRVLEQLPFREKVLGSYLREHKVGRVEIKKRQIDVDPESLRRKLKLKGDVSATLLLARIGKREVALVAERC